MLFATQKETWLIIYMRANTPAKANLLQVVCWVLGMCTETIPSDMCMHERCRLKGDALYWDNIHLTYTSGNRMDHNHVFIQHNTHSVTCTGHSASDQVKCLLETIAGNDMVTLETMAA